MHNVHYHGYATGMGVVDKRLKLLGSAETARRGKEVRHMVAERAVVGVLLYGHYLDGVVTVGSDSRQHLGAELAVGADALALLRHAYVAFVYEQRRRVGHESLVGPRKRPFGFVDLSRENMRRRVLHHTGGIGRYALGRAAGPVYLHLVQLSVPDGIGSHFHLPHARHAFANPRQAVLGQLLPA